MPLQQFMVIVRDRLSVQRYAVAAQTSDDASAVFKATCADVLTATASVTVFPGETRVVRID